MKNVKVLFSNGRSMPDAETIDVADSASMTMRLIAVPVIASLVLVSACVDGSETGQVATVDGVQSDARIQQGVQLVSASGKYLAGRYARRSRDFSTAANYLSDALSIDANNRKIRRQTFFALVAGGRMSEAAVLAKEIVAADKGAAIANLSLVVEDAFASKFDAAAKRLDSMPRRGMSTFAAPLLLAWTKAALGDIEGAVKSLDALKKIASFAALRHMHVGLIYEQAGKTELADQALKKASKGTTSIRVVMGYGHFLERQGRLAEAKALYDGYIAKNSGDALEGTLERLAAKRPPPTFVATPKDGLAEVFFNLAGTLAQGRSSDLALIYGRMALRLRPKFPLAQLLLGGLLESLSRGADAIALYEKVDPKSPVSWSARLRRASSLDEMGKTQDAIALLEKMAEERKDRFEPLIRIGDLHRSKKKFEDAIASYDRAIKRVGTLEKNHWSLLYARGIAFERAKQWPNAEKDFLHALELSPEQPFVLNYLGYSWVDQGLKLDRAKKMIRRAVELRPNDGYIVDSLGWVLYRLGDYPAAAKNLERAVVLRPEDPTINDHLGDAYWRVGRKFEARFRWKRALSLDPEKDLIPQIEEKLRDGLKKKDDGDNRS
ncbi:MAG: tetratricopeptide repeat protein [Alphaproteobacteria bacterium]|nr:tetratricopeptide repeat protein [Alphaproteobacteria bacterium]